MLARVLGAAVAFGLALSACSGAGGQPTTPVPSGAGPSCQPFGGCDVLEDLSDGTQRLVALDTQSYPDALTRALYDAQRSDVRDTVVVGHTPPHEAISGLLRH